MRDGPSVTIRRPRTHCSLAVALSLSHHDALTTEHGIGEFGCRRAKAVGISKGSKTPQLLVGRVVGVANIEP